MKAILALLFLSYFHSVTLAQNDPGYYNWIYFTNKQGVQRGAIVETKDSTVLFVDYTQLKRENTDVKASAQVIPVSSIYKIMYRKRNNVKRGIIIGGLAGAAAGAIIGYASGDDSCDSNGWLCVSTFTAEEKAGVGALIGLFPGMGIGALFGSGKETIYINGDQEVYNLTRDELKKYTLTKE